MHLEIASPELVNFEQNEFVELQVNRVFLKFVTMFRILIHDNECVVSYLSNESYSLLYDVKCLLLENFGDFFQTLSPANLTKHTNSMSQKIVSRELTCARKAENFRSVNYFYIQITSYIVQHILYVLKNTGISGK